MTATSPFLPEAVFSTLPARLRNELRDAFQKIVRNYAEHRWEPSELNGGKFAEIAYCIVKGVIDGSFPARARKPPNMVDACKELERAPSAVPRSVKIQIPRMLVALYEVRNNRNVGHVGGEVDPNHMDAVCVLQIAKWIMAEFVRVLHELPIDEAASVVEALVERDTPLVWKVGDKLRILDTSLTMKQKVLILLYATSAPLTDRQLIEFVGCSGRFGGEKLIAAGRSRCLSSRGRRARLGVWLSGIRSCGG